MKKKIFSLALAVLFLAAISTSAVAASGFNEGVFEGRTEIASKYDDMTDTKRYYMPAMAETLGDGYISLGFFVPNIYIEPKIGVTDGTAIYYWEMTYNYDSSSAYYMKKMIVKIGDNRYTFDGIYNNREDYGDRLQSHKEFLSVIFDESSVCMMEDLINHRDEEIKVRIFGDNAKIDFVLPEAAKNNFIHMYNLYAAGGGTEQSNLRAVRIANNVSFTANIK